MTKAIVIKMTKPVRVMVMIVSVFIVVVLNEVVSLQWC
jgi:hypothetical protein